MPNHVTNILTIKGDKQDVELVIDLIKSNIDNEILLIDFNQIIPMPPSLGITSGSRVDDAISILTNDEQRLKQMMEYPWAKDFKNTEELKEHIKSKLSEKDLEEGRMAIDNIEKYGHKDWYSWRLANWGTKWNAYSIRKLNFDTIKFDTAWSSPFAIMEELSRMFPEIAVEVKFADEDIGYNCGIYTLLNGEVVEEYEPKGAEATKFAMIIKDLIKDDEYLMEVIIDYFLKCELQNIERFKEEMDDFLKNQDDLFLQKLKESIKENKCENEFEIWKFFENYCVKNEFYEVAQKLILLK